MNTLKYLFLLSTAALLLSPFAYAEETEEVSTVTLNTPLFGRSSVNFKDKTNINSTIPTGTKGDILEVRQLQSGSYGVRVKVTTLGKNATDKAPKIGDETWLYYSQKEPGLDFITKKGEEIDDPEEALVKRAQVDATALGPLQGTVAKPALPSQQKVLSTSKPVREDERDIIIPAPGEDPNLAKNGAVGATEGGYGFYCMNGRCSEVASNNRRDLTQISKDTPEAKPGTSVEKKPKSQDTTPVPRSNDPNNKWANDPLVSKYSNSPVVKRMIAQAMANKRSHSTKKCYRFVKRALLATGMTKSYLPGVNAKDGVRDLLNQNAALRAAGKPTWKNLLADPKYRNMIRNPGDAPKGAVLIFQNGRPEPGDAAIKTDNGANGGYVNDFYSPRPITKMRKGITYERMGVGYKLIGVMITED